MPYIGNQPAEQFTSFATQEFSTSATTSYTLDHAVTNENEIALFINNVRQQPGSGKAYTATGTALTLSAATASTDTMYCVFLGRALQTVTPATNSITAAMVGNDLISGKDALTSSPDDTDELLISDAGTLKRIDVSLVGGKNTPMFYSYMSGNQSIGTGAITKMQFSQEEYDIGSTFDTSNYRYTPGFVGKSFLIGSGRWNSGGDWNNNFLYIYKNGSAIFTAKEVHTHYDIIKIGVVVDHDDNDYFELYIEQQSGGSVDLYGGSGNKNETYFQGFKLIT